jgi:hypothetical protein
VGRTFLSDAFDLDLPGLTRVFLSEFFDVDLWVAVTASPPIAVDYASTLVWRVSALPVWVGHSCPTLLMLILPVDSNIPTPTGGDAVTATHKSTSKNFGHRSLPGWADILATRNR